MGYTYFNWSYMRNSQQLIKLTVENYITHKAEAQDHQICSVGIRTEDSKFWLRTSRSTADTGIEARP